MTDSKNPASFGIGEMSRQTGVGIETIRYFEKIGLMPVPWRTEGGNRRYHNDHLQRLLFINRCRQVKFSQAEIKALLSKVDAKKNICAEVHDITSGHLANIRKKIQDLRKLEKVLTQLTSECGNGEIPNCPIIESLSIAPI